MQPNQRNAKYAKAGLRQIGLKIFMVLALIGLVNGCSSSPFYHKYVMSGQVVNVDGDDVIVCVADTSELDTKYQFEVRRSVFINGLTEDGESLYRLETVGKIRLKEIKDQHYAVATVISGEIKTHDMVELSSN